MRPLKIRTLATSLARASVEKRLRLALSLRSQPTGTPVGAILAELLRDPVPLVRSTALAMASECDEPPVAAICEALGEDQPEEVQLQAIGTLGFLGDAAVTAIPRLIALLATKNPAIRFCVAKLLGSFGAAAQRALIESMKSTEPEARVGAIEALGWSGLPLPKGFWPSSWTGLSAAGALTVLWAKARCGEGRKKALSMLVEATSHDDPRVRRDAIERLLTLDLDRKAWEKLLESRLRDEDDEVRRLATRAATAAPTSDNWLMVRAARALVDPDDEVRAMGCLAFATRRLECNEAREILIQLEKGDAPRVAALAKNALEHSFSS
ncbi:MAG: HEAT repeat domain-containing protein [Planctomycetota bacterium]